MMIMIFKAIIAFLPELIVQTLNPQVQTLHLMRGEATKTVLRVCKIWFATQSKQYIPRFVSQEMKWELRILMLIEKLTVGQTQQ